MRNLRPSPGSTAAPATLPSPALRVGKTVLLVSAEPFIRELMATQLRAAGCFPMAVATDEEAQRLAAQMVPDLVVVDLDASPSGNAEWALRLARATVSKTVHIAILTSAATHNGSGDLAGGGVELCVAKPFEPRELLNQLLRLLRPPKGPGERQRARPSLRASLIELDRQHPTARIHLPGGWHTLDLPWTEHRLLACLLADTERARSREEIRDAVWSDSPVDLRTVDQYVRRLRRTLDALGARDLIKTINGVGYRLDMGALKRALT